MSRVSDCLGLPRQGTDLDYCLIFLRPFLVDCPLQLLCVFRGRAGTQLWACLHMYAGAYKSQRLVLTVFLHFLRRLASLAGQPAPGIFFPPRPPVLDHTHITVPGFVHGWRGSPLGPGASAASTVVTEPSPQPFPTHTVRASPGKHTPEFVAWRYLVPDALEHRDFFNGVTTFHAFFPIWTYFHLTVPV